MLNVSPRLDTRPPGPRIWASTKLKSATIFFTLKIMDWPTIGISAATAVIVAYLGPQFQHLMWKKQKLREQRINVAERFAKLGSHLSVATHSVSPTAPASQLLEVASLYLEQFALLQIIQVLFEEPITREAGTAFKRVLDEIPPKTAGSETFENVSKINLFRVQLLACLFAEAYEISTSRLAHLVQAGPPPAPRI